MQKRNNQKWPDVDISKQYLLYTINSIIGLNPIGTSY